MCDFGDCGTKVSSHTYTHTIRFCAMAMTHRLEKLTFTGKEEDFLYFQELFESRMHLLKLRDVLLDKVEIPEVSDRGKCGRTAACAGCGYS